MMQAQQTRDARRARPGDGTILVPVAVDAAVDAASMLVAVHARVERQFAAFEEAEGSHRKQYQAVRGIGTALATHVTLEDELLYPALRGHTARHDREIERQLEQNHLLDTIMVELGGMIPADRRYEAKVRVLMQVFRQHALDTEGLLVPELRRVLEPGEREQLARRLLERVGQLEGRLRPGWW